MRNTTTSTEAGRAVQISTGAELLLKQNATADRAARIAKAKHAEAALNGQGYKHDTPPISAEQAEAERDQLFVGKASVATIPQPPKAEAKIARKFSLATTVDYRGRAITIQAEGMTLDQFCDLLDERGYTAPAPILLSAPLATPDDLPEGYKLCRKHGAPMKPRSKQGDVWNSHNVGTAEKPLWCKGYAGPDSPGYEVGQ